MITATTKKGTTVEVSYVKDAEPNKNGMYCMIAIEPGCDTYDDFCIHSSDCDCNDENAIELFVKDYVSKIEEY